VTRIVHVSVALALLAVGILAGDIRGAQATDGQMVWAVHVTVASRWLDPGETESAITPFMVLYAIHDALVKPMPAGPTTPSLAESWTMSSDGTTYEFLLRGNAKFHDGSPVTAEDVKFSFDRYRGGAAAMLKDKVAAAPWSSSSILAVSSPFDE
jgi:peptide/nickel transport system substrate-binding protein